MEVADQGPGTRFLVRPPHLGQHRDSLLQQLERLRFVAEVALDLAEARQRNALGRAVLQLAGKLQRAAPGQERRVLVAGDVLREGEVRGGLPLFAGRAGGRVQARRLRQRGDRTRCIAGEDLQAPEVGERLTQPVGVLCLARERDGLQQRVARLRRLPEALLHRGERAQQTDAQRRVPGSGPILERALERRQRLRVFLPADLLLRAREQLLGPLAGALRIVRRPGGRCAGEDGADDERQGATGRDVHGWGLLVKVTRDGRLVAAVVRGPPRG